MDGIRPVSSPVTPVPTRGPATLERESAAEVRDTFQASEARVSTRQVEATARRSFGQWARLLLFGPVAAAVAVATDEVRQSHFQDSREHASPEAAQEAFQDAREVLLDPSRWKGLGPRLAPADFALRGPDGQPKAGAPSAGDHLDIKIPGPGPHVWVRVEKVSDRPDEVELVVRPSPRPDSPEGGVAHFFSDQTTNTFRLVRDGNRVTASVSGGDERRNDTGGLVVRLFNYLRLVGTWAGAKKPQWNAFTRNLVEVPDALRRTGVDTALSVHAGAMQPRF